MQCPSGVRLSSEHSTPANPCHPYWGETRSYTRSPRPPWSETPLPGGLSFLRKTILAGIMPLTTVPLAIDSLVRFAKE